MRIGEMLSQSLTGTHSPDSSCCNLRHQTCTLQHCQSAASLNGNTAVSKQHPFTAQQGVGCSPGINQVGQKHIVETLVNCEPRGNGGTKRTT